MANPPPLADVVMLYRRAGRPDWSNRQFHGELDYAESQELLSRLRQPGTRGGHLDELKIDGQFVMEEDELPVKGKRASFTYSTSTQEGSRFFRSADELVNYRPLGRGVFPERFYLISEDYQHGLDEPVPDTVRKLIRLTDFIDALADLADHKYDTEGTGAWTLVFRTRDGLGLLEANVTSDLAGVCVPEVAWRLVRELRIDVHGIHQKERRWMFKATMCEFLKGRPSFGEFVEQSERWAIAYEDDLQTYLSGFSFEEVKRKISEENAQFVDQISKILGDITMKVLSLPLSVAVVMIFKTQAKMAFGFPLILLLFFLVALAISFLIRHYQRVVPRVEQNIAMVFGKMERAADVASQVDLENRVEEVVRSLRLEIRKLRTTLRIYLLLAWTVPAIGVIAML